jgi:hypothetical protein
MDRKLGTLGILKIGKPKQKSYNTLEEDRGESLLLGGSGNGARNCDKKKSVDQADLREID